MVSQAGNARADALDLRRLGRDCVVESQRPVDQATRDLTAIGHLAQGCGIQRRGDLGRHCFNSRQQSHLRVGDTQRVLDGDLELFIEASLKQGV